MPPLNMPLMKTFLHPLKMESVLDEKNPGHVFALNFREQQIII